jgi:phage baseplate assembly protein W
MAKIFSPEDGNLSKSARVTRERTFSDVDLTLDARIAPTYSSGDGDVLRKTDAAAVKQSLKNLLLTNRFEKPFRPAFGGDLGSLLFEMMDTTTADKMIQQIRSSVKRFEPRAIITNLKIVATPDYNEISVVIEFRIVNSQVSDTLRIKLSDQGGVLPVVLPVTATPVPDEIILSEAGNRLLTFAGLLLRTDELGILDGAILTVGTNGDVQLLTQDEKVILSEQV